MRDVVKNLYSDMVALLELLSMVAVAVVWARRLFNYDTVVSSTC